MTQLLAHLFGDYIFQSDWMAQGKTKRSWPALAHALLYSLCFVPLCWHPDTFSWAIQQMDTIYIERIWQSVNVFHWKALLAIFCTHFLIDRFRLARYVVWAKNWMGPWKHWANMSVSSAHGLNRGEHLWMAREDVTMSSPEIFQWHYSPTLPLWACPTGYPPTTPIWLSTWLLIIADNTLHLAINYAALRWL